MVELRARRPLRPLFGVRPLAFDRLPSELVLRYGYNVLFRRDPDPGGTAHYLERLVLKQLTPAEFVDNLRGSEEFESHTPFAASAFGPSLHASRCHFIRSLPKASRIVDLGGTHSGSAWGALVLMGYPYEFESLTIIDLPPDDRHPLYKSEEYQAVETARGPVRYAYHSMTDLSSYADESVDLVYSGQSIEHVTPEDGASVCRQVFRILQPGGWFAVDTPNARVTRLESDEFIDPDHEVEYTADELAKLLEDAGFDVVERKGLNYAGRSVASGTFDPAEIAANRGLYAEGDSCYVLAFVARKPPLSAE